MVLIISLGICGFIAALLVSVADNADETISGGDDCCFGMFDLSRLVIVRVEVVGMDCFAVASSCDVFKENALTIGVTNLGIVAGVTLASVLTRGGVTTVGAGITGETPAAFKGLLLLRGVCFVRGDDAFGDALTGVVDDGVSIVRGTVSFVSFNCSEDVFGFGEVCVGAEALIDISGGLISITVEIIDGDMICLSTV